MRPLRRAGESLRTAREGTARTLRWVGGGIASGPRRAAAAARGDGKGGERPEGAAAPRSAAPTSERDAGPGLLERLRASGRSSALRVAGGLLVLAWLGWAAYIWTENGSAAGIGVLISWPAVLAALAIVTSPFWATGLYVRRRQVATANGAQMEAAPEGGGSREAAGASDESGAGSDPRPSAADRVGTPQSGSEDDEGTG